MAQRILGGNVQVRVQGHVYGPQQAAGETSRNGRNRDTPHERARRQPMSCPHCRKTMQQRSFKRHLERVHGPEAAARARRKAQKKAAKKRARKEEKKRAKKRRRQAEANSRQVQQRVQCRLCTHALQRRNLKQHYRTVHAVAANRLPTLLGQ